MSTKQSEAIPLIVMEEHNEAFYVWNWAIQNRYISKVGNLLLHVDEHSDMSSGRFNIKADTLNGDLYTLRKFTHTELAIDTFVSTGIYKGILNNVAWVKQKHEGSMIGESIGMYVRSYNNMGKRLIIGRTIDSVLHERIREETDIKYFGYRRLHIPGIYAEENQILDIDLDFFSCVGNPAKQRELVIEISENEFDSFSENTYHRLNYLFSRVEVVKEKEKYYYLINGYNEIYPETTYVSNGEVQDRIRIFVGELRSKEVKPRIITLCRSRFSGFTPNDQWELIENELCEKLSELYCVNIIYYHQI
jgi:UPF0489 domain